MRLNKSPFRVASVLLAKIPISAIEAAEISEPANST
jgi:hypothetical protein